MLVGVVGAPNKGKSTFFAAATAAEVQIANYPFTTISPNKGVTYVRAECAHLSLGIQNCSRCMNGTRLVPVNIVDVAGLVPGAHEGKGLGNKFLDDLRQADALIQVVDASGKTDLYGNPAADQDPLEEVKFLKEEFAWWICQILERKKHASSKEAAQSLSGLKITEAMLANAARRCGLDISSGLPAGTDLFRLAEALVDERMPIVVAYNKMDLPGAEKNLQKAKERGLEAFPCCAAAEFALRKAAMRGIVQYTPGDSTFSIKGAADERQMEALDWIFALMKKNGGTGVQQIIDYVVYRKLMAIVVYPVEDEHKCTNHKGEVLPDALLVPQGTTARQLAALIHTELASSFICAIDVKRKVRIGAEHALRNGDVIKVVAGR
ncbi:MAG: YchF-related putative GTPase [Candidatus Micrarchaeota archaeon]|nr:YchF-related putative GTPase [Candidatus Micrarchaeota archaeon]